MFFKKKTTVKTVMLYNLKEQFYVSVFYLNMI